MTMDLNHAVPAIVSRLCECYDPFDVLGVERDVKRVMKHKPRDRHTDPLSRTVHYHYGRIRYLMENPDPTPIEVEAGIPGYSNYSVSLLDGHHRLCAAVLRGDQTIPAVFGGWVDFIRYVTGERKTDPWGKVG